MAIEFRLLGINFAREVNIPVFYKQELIGERRVDFLVEGKICVELKAVIQLENVHLAQGKNYLEAYNLETGLLINFGSNSLQYKKIFHPVKHPINPKMSESGLTNKQDNHDKKYESNTPTNPKIK